MLNKAWDCAYFIVDGKKKHDKFAFRPQRWGRWLFICGLTTCFDGTASEDLTIIDLMIAGNDQLSDVLSPPALYWKSTIDYCQNHTKRIVENERWIYDGMGSGTLVVFLVRLDAHRPWCESKNWQIIYHVFMLIVTTGCVVASKWIEVGVGSFCFRFVNHSLVWRAAS